jgi:hypothetical protein
MVSLAGDEGEGEPSRSIPRTLRTLAQAKRREFATDAEVEAAFRRFDP